MIAWGLFRPTREASKLNHLLSITSEAIDYDRTINIWGDDWLGYMVFRSAKFQRLLDPHKIKVNFEIVADFSKRIQGLHSGECEFAVATLDSYLANANDSHWPAAIIFVVDESYGGDAIVGLSHLSNIDDLNKPEIKGSFVGFSPSEFFLRSEVSHFKLENLRPQLERFRSNDIKESYQALAKGKVDFAVLWEPQVTQALKKIQGAKVLIDTRHAQGLIIDIALASRKVISDEPKLAELITHAYFKALHEYLNNPNDFIDAAARDSGEKTSQAQIMTNGIKFATFEENHTYWLSSASQSDPPIIQSIAHIKSILDDHELSSPIPRNDPYALIYRGILDRLQNSPHTIPPASTSVPAIKRLKKFYDPLSEEAWKQLSQKVRGTLIDQPITFRPGSTAIPEDFQILIQEATPILNHYPDYRIIVEAHVSPSDQPDLDQQLSEQRAQAVKNYLIEACQISQNRIYAYGKGSSELPQRLEGESIRAYNKKARRAKILLVGD